MSNKIRVLTNISASQNVIVSGSTVISGSKLLATTSSFNNSSIVTSSDGFYNMPEVRGYFHPESCFATIAEWEAVAKEFLALQKTVVSIM